MWTLQNEVFKMVKFVSLCSVYFKMLNKKGKCAIKGLYKLIQITFNLSGKWVRSQMKICMSLTQYGHTNFPDIIETVSNSSLFCCVFILSKINVLPIYPLYLSRVPPRRHKEERGIKMKTINEARTMSLNLTKSTHLPEPGDPKSVLCCPYEWVSVESHEFRQCSSSFLVARARCARVRWGSGKLPSKAPSSAVRLRESESASLNLMFQSKGNSQGTGCFNLWIELFVQLQWSHLAVCKY